MAFADREELLDALFDHVFPEDEGEVDDETMAWFDDKMTSFFAGLEGEKPPGRRRKRNQPAPPSRPGSIGAGTSSGRRRGQSQADEDYGLRVLFGGRKTS